MGTEFWDRLRRPRRRRRPPPPDPPSPDPPPTPQGHGFVEAAESTAVRQPLTGDEIRRFMPARGAFQFPDPYGTQGIRLTAPEDGEIWPVGYSYWPNVNNHAGSEVLYAFVGRRFDRPMFYRVHKVSGAVEPLGALLPYIATAEGWYWSAVVETDLFLIDGPRLRRVNPLTGADDVVFEVRPELYLWQAHSSDDGQTHSATIRQASTYRTEGAVVYRRGVLTYLAANGVLDEVQLDTSGRYLVMKEDDDNRILDLETGTEQVLRNREGAAGHSDCGWETLVGEDDYHAQPGALREWALSDLSRPATLHYHLTQWDTGLGHVSVRRRRALISHASRLVAPRVNEFVDVPLDGSLHVRVLCPNLVDLNAGPQSDYDKLPKANLDPTGTYACWTANCGTDRLDAFLVRTV